MLPAAFFTRDPLVCARELIGCELVWDGCAGRIVETEAYAAEGDESCHTFLRRGARTFVETHPAGTAYIYQNYGIHWLLNVLVKGATAGGADGFVLVRALEPTRGLETLRARRGVAAAAKDDRLLCSGPGRLTVALGIPPAFHGQSLCADPARAFHAIPAGGARPEIVADVRIGISRAADFPWRFLERGSAYVSRKPGKSWVPV